MTAASGRTRVQNVGLVLGLAALARDTLHRAARRCFAGGLDGRRHDGADGHLVGDGGDPVRGDGADPARILPPLGAASAADLAGGYGNTTLFLILGGFLLGLAMERCNLHRRIAYAIVARAGGHPRASCSA